jgi:hypothetical protein
METPENERYLNIIHNTFFTFTQCEKNIGERVPYIDS